MSAIELSSCFPYLPDALEDSFASSHPFIEPDAFESLADTLFWHDGPSEHEAISFSERSASHSTASETNSPPSSASSTLDIDARESTQFRLTWPEKGQLRISSLRSPKHSRPLMTEGLPLTSLSKSPLDASPTDSHHEGSCAKCRMTEVEARKCRLDRRREQNRASQRKFRARKEAKIREAASQVATLEAYVEFLESHNSDLESLNAELRQRVLSMESEKQLSDVTIKEGELRALVKPAKDKRDYETAARRSMEELYLPLFDHELHPAQSGLAAV